MSLSLVRSNRSGTFDLSIVTRACIDAMSASGVIDPITRRDVLNTSRGKGLNRAVREWIAYHYEGEDLDHFTHAEAMDFAEAAGNGEIPIPESVAVSEGTAWPPDEPPPMA